MGTIERIRQKTPLVHHITNDVVMNFTANGLLSFGGSPIMAKEMSEVKEIASIADGLLLNIGTALAADIDAMVLAGKAANEAEVPVVLDPVGVAASAFRRQATERLLEEITFTAIKGNAGEIAHLAGASWEARGVDSADGDIEQLEHIAKDPANKYETIIVVTGPVDVIAWPGSDHALKNDTGVELLTKVTGAGCLLGSLLAAGLGAHKDEKELAHIVYDVLKFYGEASERAASGVTGTGTFAARFIDELAAEEN